MTDATATPAAPDVAPVPAATQAAAEASAARAAAYTIPRRSSTPSHPPPGVIPFGSNYDVGSDMGVCSAAADRAAAELARAARVKDRLKFEEQRVAEATLAVPRRNRGGC